MASLALGSIEANNNFLPPYILNPARSRLVMNLQELSSALPKQWLNINAQSGDFVTLDATTANVDTLSATVAHIDDIVVDAVESKALTLVDQAGVPNPTIGSHTLFSNLAGVLTTQNSAGVATAYVPTSGATMTGDLSMGGHNLTNVDSIDGTGTLNIGATSSSVALASTTQPTIIQGRGYVGTTRPIMSGGFTMLTNTTVANTTAETTIIGAGMGSLTSSANGFTVGYTSHSTISGTLRINATPTLTIRVYGGPAGATLISAFPIALSTLGVNVPWKMNNDVVVKSIGVAGVASIQLNSTFTVYDTVAVVSYVNQNLNSTTFDTTTANVLNITAQWSAAHVNNTVTTNQLFTHSIYF